MLVISYMYFLVTLFAMGIKLTPGIDKNITIDDGK